MCQRLVGGSRLNILGKTNLKQKSLSSGIILIPKTLCINGTNISVTLLTVYIPSLTLKNVLSGNINTRLGNYKTLLFKVKCPLCSCLQGWTFGNKPWGQLALKFSDLVASKSISVKRLEKLVTIEKIGCIGNNPAVAMSSSGLSVQLFLKIILVYINN